MATGAAGPVPGAPRTFGKVLEVDVAIYALMGSLVWQLIFRPLEEDDLRGRFGKEYEEYSRVVKCWIPRTERYQIEGTTDSSNSIDSPFGRM